MNWLELTVETTDQGLDPVCAALLGVGLESVSIEESKETVAAGLRENDMFWDYAALETLGAETPRVRAWLPDLPESRPIIEMARTAVLALSEQINVTLSVVEESDWADNWKQFWGPTPVGQRLLVLPSWEEPLETEREILLLDPGMAFGTGTHETTRLCMELLEQAIHGGDRVLDLGCGSGILSIAAVKLGAAHVTAVDIDPVAEKVTRENAQRNGIAGRMTVRIGNVLTDTAFAATLTGKYQVILSNIVADAVIALAPIVKPLLAPDGRWILSGIIGERVPDVEAALEACNYRILSRLSEGEWHACCVR
ncbi:MAG: 50S ribosomal protein L11 methyltransferase [Clostridiales bacterium]|nr:50S ribosomal protein L11 methyltransferase [Clostridiales bacterium]